MSATPAFSAPSTSTLARLRNDLAAFASSSVSTTSVAPPRVSASRPAACLVEGASKPAASTPSFSLPEPRRIGASAIGAHLHGGALGPGDRATQEHQVLVGNQLDDLQALLGHALGAHVAGTADALHHAGGSRRGADRARGTHVVRAVGLRT